MPRIDVFIANTTHLSYAEDISRLIEDAARDKGSGLAKRTPEYLREKIADGKAVIALSETGELAGFCYIESWGHEQYVANSGLIVDSRFRGGGLARRIKEKAFDLSRQKFPKAKLFGLTTSLAVMKINSYLGYKPVTFSELTDDEKFWGGCSTCANYDILQRTKRTHCLCTGMLYDPADKNEKYKPRKSLKVYDRWFRFKKHVLSKLFQRNGNGKSKQ